MTRRRNIPTSNASQGLERTTKPCRHESEGSGWNFDGGIDNIGITRVTPQTPATLTDDFESYALGAFPSPPWRPDANAVSDTTHNLVAADPLDASNRVLQLNGTHPGNCSALAYHPCTFPERFEARLRVFVHAYFVDSVGRGAVAQMRRGSTWTNPGRTLLFFGDDGTITLGGTAVGAYEHDRWYDVRVLYDRSGNRLELTAWLDGLSLGSVTLAISDVATEASLDHFGFDVRGALLFDDVEVTCLAD